MWEDVRLRSASTIPNESTSQLPPEDPAYGVMRGVVSE
jgi:hypothetical protein